MVYIIQVCGQLVSRIRIEELLISAAFWDEMERSSRKQQLFDIYRCCMSSFELLMMDGKTVRNMYNVLQE
jgi:hypothetical protein